MQRSVFAMAVSLAVIVYADVAHSIEPEVRCESSKLRVSGKYAACRLNVEARAVLAGETPDPTKCEETFTTRFTGVEERGGTECPTEGDDEGVAEDVEKFAQGIVEKVKYPGLRGKVRLYTPAGHHWLEDDGVEPETPGCHRAFTDETCTTPLATPESVIGEACVTHGAETLLLETNPDAPLCHEHHEEQVLGVTVTDDGIAGHPYLYSCEEYCQGRYGLTGACQVVAGFCGGGINSAKCVCTAAPPL